jgi:hypothetical protein
MMAQLLEASNSPQKTLKETHPAPPTTDPAKMHWKSFQKLATPAGIEWSPQDPREPVIEKLNG